MSGGKTLAKVRLTLTVRLVGRPAADLDAWDDRVVLVDVLGHETAERGDGVERVHVEPVVPTTRQKASLIEFENEIPTRATTSVASPDARDSLRRGRRDHWAGDCETSPWQSMNPLGRCLWNYSTNRSCRPSPAPETDPPLSAR